MIVLGDARSLPLRDGIVQTCVTSPPYWGLRDYGVEGQIGLEPTPEEYVAGMVAVFREVRRVLRDDGTLWLNLGDSYAGYHGNSRVPDDAAPSNKPGYVENMRETTVGVGGLKPKDLVGIPWRVAFALQADGWYLRSDIIWAKPNPMPESVTDRPTKSHEYLFLLSKSERYFYDAEAVKEPCAESSLADPRFGDEEHAAGGRKRNVGGRTDGYTISNRPVGNPSGRNRRTVWTVPTQPYAGAHFATFPEKLIEPCILAGSSSKGACAECGAPWERVTGRPCRECGALIPTQGKECEACGFRNTEWREERTFNPALVAEEGRPGRRVGRRAPHRVSAPPQGWRPTCPHSAPTRPCIVLDPFAGSGTTVRVARRFGRRGVGIELNPKYLPLAAERIVAQVEMFA